MELVSARTAPAGGQVSGRIAPTNFAPGASRIVILIHGFNVNQSGGEKSFNTFGGLLANHGLPELSVLGQVIGYLWPGDVNLGPISGISYPAEMGAAEKSASLLSQFLLGLRGPNGSPLQVTLVAHSLGNRVALECINDLLNQANEIWGRMEGICLMAAAVTVAVVDKGGRLSRAATSLRTRTMFSEADSVLHWDFPPGETAAGEGFFPQAVGRFGNPPALWTDTRDLQPYNHGNYFLGLQTTVGLDDRSAQYVAQFMGAAVATQTPINQLLANQLPVANVIPSRSVGSDGQVSI